MALKIHRNNTSILDTFNDEDIQKEYDRLKAPIIANNIYDAYEQYLQFKSMNICSCYKPKSTYELRKWIRKQNDKRVKVLDVSWIDVSDMTDLMDCFYNCKNIIEITGLENWDVRNVTNMAGMFYDCETLTSLKGIENWDVRNVTTMLCMFAHCQKLKKIDVSNWDVKNVQRMWDMFNECTSLTTLNGIEDWDVRNVEGMFDMFKGCDESIIPSWYPYK